MLYNIFSVNHAEFKQILTQKSWKIGVKTIIKRLHTTLDLPSIIEENKWCFNQHWTSKKGEMSIEYWKIKIISGTTKYTGWLHPIFGRDTFGRTKFGRPYLVQPKFGPVKFGPTHFWSNPFLVKPNLVEPKFGPAKFGRTQIWSSQIWSNHFSC